MPARELVLAEGTEVRVGQCEGNQFKKVLEIEADAGNWRWGIDCSRRPALLATRDADGDLADLPVPDWMDDVLARYDIREVDS